MRVLILKLNHLGDNVVFVPVVQALRRLCPDWHLTVLTTPNEAALYGGPLGAQEVWTSAKRAFDKSHRRPWRLLRWLAKARLARPDACLVSFDQGSAAHLVARASGARFRVGGNLDFIRVRHSLTREIPIPADGRPVSWNWAMARGLAAAFGRDTNWPTTPPPPDLGFLVPDRPPPRGGSRRVVVHAGAGKSLNQWPRQHFAAVAAGLAADHEVLWIEHGESTGSAPAGAAPVRPASLGDLAGALAGADLFLGNNSGPMHLANALGVCGVAVTGPTAAGWDPYWHPTRWTVLRHPSLACAPCEKPHRELEGCVNLESPMACLSYWTPARVEAACRERLGAGPGTAP